MRERKISKWCEKNLKSEEEKRRKLIIHEKLEIKYREIIEFIRSLFQYSYEIIVIKKITIDDKKFRRILLVSNLDDFKQKWNEIRKVNDFPYNLKKKNLKIFLTINKWVVVELLEDIIRKK